MPEGVLRFWIFSEPTVCLSKEIIFFSPLKNPLSPHQRKSKQNHTTNSKVVWVFGINSLNPVIASENIHWVFYHTWFTLLVVISQVLISVNCCAPASEFRELFFPIVKWKDENGVIKNFNKISVCNLVKLYQRILLVTQVD